MYIEAGMYVIGGANSRVNHKERPVKLHRAGHYPDLLQMVTAHPVAFYDVEGRRVWLVDGASALLHLTRISLYLDATDPESPYDWTFDETKLCDAWTGCNGRIAALNTLKNWEHRALPIFVTKQTNVGGQIVREYATFEDRVMQILHWFEVIIDRDVYLASEGGIKIRQTMDRHKCISGFDILDLLKPLGPIGTRVAPLSRTGGGWADLFPATGTTTIFGRGFGELIRPNDNTQICTEWKTVPTGLDIMAATTSTLKMIYEKRLRRNSPNLREGELTDNLLWSSSSDPLKRCGCITSTTTGKEEHVHPLQFLTSKR